MMQKTLIIASLLVLAILAISVTAQMLPISKIEEEVEKVRERILINVTPEQARHKMMIGEVKLNITPHLPSIPVFPPIECPPFMVIDLPYKVHIGRVHGQVMRYLHEKNLTLPQICADKAKVETLVREAIEHVNLTRVCAGLERASEHCKEMKPFACEKIKDAIPLCAEGLISCKATEKRAEIAKEAWKERVKALKEVLEKQEEALKELVEEGSEEAEISAESPVPKLAEIPKIEGVIPKCHVEESTCEHLQEAYERCVEFHEKCAPRCEVIDGLVAKCKAAITDKEVLVTEIVDFIWSRCQLINYTVSEAEVEKAEKETIPPAEIQPVIMVTKPLNSTQEAQIRALVEKLEQIYKDESWIYRALVRANKIEDLRELNFVLTVKLDHVMRALQRKTFKELPELPEFAPAVAKILPHLEGVKVKVEAELQPAITEAEVKIINSSEAITEHHKEEKARGIGYAILKFLGLEASRERKDAKFLDEKAKDLSEVAKSLRDVAKTEERAEIKALILEKVAELQKNIDALTARAAEKHRRAFGLWSWLGLR